VRWLGTDGVSESRGECGGDGLPEADMVLAWMRRRGWPHFIERHCVEATQAAPRERKELTARRCGRARVLTRRRGTAAKGPRGGHARCICPYVSVGVVSWIGGHPGVHAAQ
jgi:hypothetical protein